MLLPPAREAAGPVVPNTNGGDEADSEELNSVMVDGGAPSRMLFVAAEPLPGVGAAVPASDEGASLWGGGIKEPNAGA